MELLRDRLVEAGEEVEDHPAGLLGAEEAAAAVYQHLAAVREVLAARSMAAEGVLVAHLLVARAVLEVRSTTAKVEEEARSMRVKEAELDLWSADWDPRPVVNSRAAEAVQLIQGLSGVMAEADLGRRSHDLHLVVAEEVQDRDSVVPAEHSFVQQTAEVHRICVLALPPLRWESWAAVVEAVVPEQARVVDQSLCAQICLRRAVAAAH